MLDNLFPGLLCLCFSIHTTQGLMCKEGINITVFEIPFYHWSERNCTGNSRCFSQEIGVKIGASTTFQYGGCISEGYSDLFSCKMLFGHNSNLDPSILLNLMVGADDLINNMVQEFRENVTNEMTILFSKGKGTEDFVEGGLLLYEMLGFNMETARELKQPLARLIRLRIARDLSNGNPSYRKMFKEAQLSLLKALENLPTKDLTIANNTYKFLKNFIHGERGMEKIKKSKIYKPLIENLPGLYKSMLSEHQMTSWIDATFDMLDQVDVRNPRKSANDIIRTFRSVMNISEESEKYIDPFLDTVPNFAFKIANYHPVHWFRESFEWGVDILGGYGDNNTITFELGRSVRSFIKGITHAEASQNLERLFTSIAGLFYRFFPAEKAEIGKALTTVTNGLKSLDFDDVASSPLMKKTKLSDFITSLVDYHQSELFSRVPGLRMKYIKVIINLSKTFYDAMTEKYADELDTFFTTLESGFKTYPDIDPGEIIFNLVTDFGSEVPLTVKPILKNVKNIMDSVGYKDSSKFYKALMMMISEYREAFPKSKFPDIARRYLENVNAALMLQSNSHNCFQEINWDKPVRPQIGKFRICEEKHMMKKKLMELKSMKSLFSIETDLFFAAFEATGFDSDERIGNISNKALASYLQLLRALDPEDVKEILSDYSTWLVNLFDESDNYKFDNFLYAINVTTAKITSKLGKFMKKLRHVHAPEYCKYLTCATGLCNTHEAIGEISPISQRALRGEGTLPVTTETRTTGSVGTVTHSTALMFATTMYFANILV